MNKFVESLVKEISLFVNDNARPPHLVLIKNKALKWYNLVEDIEEINLHSNKLIKPKVGRRLAKEFLESRSYPHVVITEPSNFDCDLEIIRFGSSVRIDKIEGKKDKLSEIFFVVKPDGKYPDTIRKYTVNEDGSLCSYFD